MCTYITQKGIIQGMSTYYYVIVMLIATMLAGVIITFFTSISLLYIIAVAIIFSVLMAIASYQRYRNSGQVPNISNVIFSLVLTAFAGYLAITRIPAVKTMTEETRWIAYLASFVACYTILNSIILIYLHWKQKK